MIYNIFMFRTRLTANIMIKVSKIQTWIRESDKRIGDIHLTCNDQVRSNLMLFIF